MFFFKKKRRRKFSLHEKKRDNFDSESQHEIFILENHHMLQYLFRHSQHTCRSFLSADQKVKRSFRPKKQNFALYSSSPLGCLLCLEKLAVAETGNIQWAVSRSRFWRIKKTAQCCNPLVKRREADCYSLFLQKLLSTMSQVPSTSCKHLLDSLFWLL